MQSIADALAHTGDRRPLTPDDRANVEDVLDAAAAWRAGELPWTVAAAVAPTAYGATMSAGYTRFLAIRTTPLSDPRRPALMALITYLIDMTGVVRTTSGMFTPAELGQSDAAVHTHRRRTGPTRREAA